MGSLSSKIQAHGFPSCNMDSKDVKEFIQTISDLSCERCKQLIKKEAGDALIHSPQTGSCNPETEKERSASEGTSCSKCGHKHSERTECWWMLEPQRCPCRKFTTDNKGCKNCYRSRLDCGRDGCGKFTTDKTDCTNCGHKEIAHNGVYYEGCGIMLDNEPYSINTHNCPCKKFKSSNKEDSTK